ncbi:hypothetical protein BDZ89DRAFT_1044453 [Hymenopellis radicata]|nr:hypothetical protein BDZ89DRAFT_1044453 [Hymenopellis radicata]
MASSSSSPSGSRKGTSSSTTNKPPSFRGACLNCRRRKIVSPSFIGEPPGPKLTIPVMQKCDGKKPICTPCTSSVSYGDCEYPERGGLTRTQALEEQIAMLESRIQQLEDPGILKAALLLLSRMRSNFKWIQLKVSLSFQIFRADKTQGLTDSSMDYTLIQTALQNSNEIGFFLNISRFYGALSAPEPSVRPLDALMNAILLWGSHLSDITGTNAYEPNFLALAVRDAAQGLASGHPQAVMHSIQAEVLLSHYFYRQSRFLEGKYHASIAVSLVLSSHLHKIQSVDEPLDVTSLPPPTDAVDEGERINGFWTVFILSNCWAAVEGSPSPFQFTSSSPEARIDLPWPLEIESYAQVFRRREFRTSRTVQNFLENQHDSGTSALALHAKASVLFEQASRIVYTYRPGMSQQQASQFFASYNALQTVIENVLANPPSPVTAGDIVTQSLVHAAMISLHAPFVAQNPGSRGRLAASMRALEVLVFMVDVPNLPVIDSIIGIIWARSCHILIKEISSMRGAPPSARDEPLRILGSMLAVMERMSARYPVVNNQLIKVRDARLYWYWETRRNLHE